MDKNNIYITTTLPYVNSSPHVGFALEIVQADALARFYRLQGREVFFNTGTDEHGQKIAEAAAKNSKDTQEYVDHYAAEFRKLANLLNLTPDNFIRTTDENHIKAAQELWHRASENGDIELKKYKGIYCVGCEAFLKGGDLNEKGECLNHPGKKPEEVEEENYFFKLRNYKERLQEYLNNSESVIPEFRRKEALQILGALDDVSISRSKERLQWGIPVPGDDSQVMYVWFDALSNYISTLGFPNEDGNFKKFWLKGHTIQMAGKDQIKFQSIIWQAMLLSAGIKPTDSIFYHGFITSGGQKMSKSIGNVINPSELVERYGVDATRYILLRHVHPTDDSDLTWERMDEWYTANLVNGLGNLVARVMKMAETHLDKPVERPAAADFSEEYIEALENFEFNAATDYIWKKIQVLDQKITETEPFKLIKTDRVAAQKLISEMVLELYSIGRLLYPIMPETNKIIKEAVLQNIKPENLFERLEFAKEENKNEEKKDISITIEPELAEKGIKVAAAICTVPKNQKRRGSELQKLIDTELAGGVVSHENVFNEYKKFYEAVGMQHATAAGHLQELFDASGTIPNINRVVDCYNLTSLKSGISFGAHDTSGITGNVKFAFTNGNEKYTPLGADKEVQVKEGEYAFMDEEKILCRMDIKQCEETKITAGTREFILYAQGNAATSTESVQEALDEVCKNIEQFCGGECKVV